MTKNTILHRVVPVVGALALGGGIGAGVYAGFGISTPEHARAVAELADGVVVGSRAVLVAEEGPDALRAYVSTLRAAVD